MGRVIQEGLFIFLDLSCIYKLEKIIIFIIYKIMHRTKKGIIRKLGLALYIRIFLTILHYEIILFKIIIYLLNV